MLIKSIRFLPMKFGGFWIILDGACIGNGVGWFDWDYLCIIKWWFSFLRTDLFHVSQPTDQGLPGLQVLHTTQNLSLASTDYIAQKWDKHENSKSKKVGYRHDLLWCWNAFHWYPLATPVNSGQNPSKTIQNTGFPYLKQFKLFFWLGSRTLFWV